MTEPLANASELGSSDKLLLLAAAAAEAQPSSAAPATCSSLACPTEAAQQQPSYPVSVNGQGQQCLLGAAQPTGALTSTAAPSNDAASSVACAADSACSVLPVSATQNGAILSQDDACGDPSELHKEGSPSTRQQNHSPPADAGDQLFSRRRAHVLPPSSIAWAAILRSAEDLHMLR